MPPTATQLGASLIVLFVAVAFEPTLSGPALFTGIDDQDNFVEHPLISAAPRGLGVGQLLAFWRPKQVTLGVWEPVASTVKAVVARLYGVDSALPFVRLSVGLHALNALAAYALSCRILATLRRRGVRGLPAGLGEDHRPVCLAALLVATCPMCAEAVSWASCQPYLLAALLSQLYVWLHLRRHHPTAEEEAARASAPAEWTIVLTMCAAALCKAAALTAFVVPASIDVLVYLHSYGTRVRRLPRARSGAARANSALSRAAASIDGVDPAVENVEYFEEPYAADEDDEDDEDEHAYDERELDFASLKARAASRRCWHLAGSSPDEALLMEAFDVAVSTHWRAVLACVVGVAVASAATTGMHGRALTMLERILRACHMLFAYPLSGLCVHAATSIRLHLPDRLEPISARFGLPTIVALLMVKGFTYAVQWYGGRVRRHIAAAAVARSKGALRVASVPPPYGTLTVITLMCAHALLLLPTLGVFGWGKRGSHIAMVRADRYAYIPSLLLGVPALAGVLQLLANSFGPPARPLALGPDGRALFERTPAVRAALGVSRKREAAFEALRAELRALGLPHDDLARRFNGMVGPLRLARGGGGGGVAASAPGAASAVAAAAAAPAAAAPAAAAAAAVGAAPAAAAAPAGGGAAPRSRARRAAPPPLWLALPLLLAAFLALRVRETRALARAWADPELLYSRVLAENPYDAPMLEALASLTMGRGSDEEGLERASALLHEALDIAPSSASVHNQLGILLKRQRRLTESEAAFRRAIELDAREPSAYVNLGNLLVDSRRDLPRAVEVLTTAAELAPARPGTHNSLGVALKTLGRYEDARAAYARALELRPSSASFQNNLGLAWMAEGTAAGALGAGAEARARARECFEAALKLQPDHAGAKQNLLALASAEQRMRLTGSS